MPVSLLTGHAGVVKIKPFANYTAFILIVI